MSVVNLTFSWSTELQSVTLQSTSTFVNTVIHTILFLIGRYNQRYCFFWLGGVVSLHRTTTDFFTLSQGDIWIGSLWDSWDPFPTGGREKNNCYSSHKTDHTRQEWLFLARRKNWITFPTCATTLNLWAIPIPRRFKFHRAINLWWTIFSFLNYLWGC